MRTHTDINALHGTFNFQWNVRTASRPSSVARLLRCTCCAHPGPAGDRVDARLHSVAFRLCV